MGARRKGRELALQMLYQWDVTRKPVDEIVDSISLLQSSGESARRFASDLVEGAVSRIAEIDRLITEHSERWRLSRMSTVDRNILRLAVYEFLAETSPKGVVINEALEVAKRFSSSDSTAFVNGVLDAVSTALQTAAGK